jgi:putative Ca2+/H+ antiporter (TMEM165/GDT1 family)
MMKALLAMFIAVFLAELGDKTQLATVMFASDREMSPWLVFLACAGALVISAAIAVALGSVTAHRLEGVPLKLAAGLGFIAIGVWTLYGHFSGS